VVRPRSCRVIYYFDTPALERRHQSFGRVRELEGFCFEKERGGKPRERESDSFFLREKGETERREAAVFLRETKRGKRRDRNRRN